MRALAQIFFIVLSVQFVYSQTKVPTAANDVQTFFLNGDELGLVENSVNLFTGEVSLPIGLISIPGRGGLSAGVTLVYNSNVEEIVDTWNLEAPTGILGLGWSMDIPRIVVDNKMTGTRVDDEYYLVEGGMSNRLYCVNINRGIREYEPERYSKWSIKFDSSNERWTIVKEDGMKYIYGDDDLNSGSAVEYVIHWDNWIGNSSNYSSSKTNRQGLVWNLAKVENRWGDAVTFEYKKVERFIKNGTGIRHTEASYLKKITDPVGRTINFIDLPKEPREYQDPHTEVAETDNSDGTGGATGDAYQERYEKRYLGNIEVKDTDNTLLHSFQFIYDVPNDGDLTKRKLASIVQKNKDGATFPSIDFSYKTSGNRKGCLEKVVYPKGGKVTYHYKETGVAIDYSDRDLTISAPSGYAEPQVWIGGDYVVVTWRQLSGSSHVTTGRNVLLYVYTWDGGWKECFRQTIGGVELYDVTNKFEYKNFQVRLWDDYFAVLKHGTSGTGTLYLTHKDPVNSNCWKMKNVYNIRVGTDDDGNSSFGDPILMAGDDFVAVGKRSDNSSYDNGVLYTYNWDGEDWRAETIKSISTGYYHGTGTNNYIIYHDEVGVSGGYADYIYFFYQDEEGEWNEQGVSPSWYFWSSDDSYWHPSNSFSFVMADDNSEYVFSWDENYNIGRTQVLSGFSNDASPVFILNNSLIGVVEVSNGKSSRYNGVSWNMANSILDWDRHNMSFGEDYSVRYVDSRDNPRIVKLQEYNPNTYSWKSELSYSDNMSGNLNTNNGLAIEATNGMFVIRDGEVYWRDTDGTWSYADDLDYGSNYLIGRSVSINSPGFAAFEYSTTSTGNPRGFYYSPVKSGGLGTSVQLSNKLFEARILGTSQSLVSPNTIVYYSKGGSIYNYTDFHDVKELTLARYIDESISGTLYEYPVEGIEINGGSDSKYIAIAYDGDFGVYNELSKGAMYNKVTVTHKDNSTSSGTFGSTEYYFINGLSSGESAVAFPSGGNAITYYKLLKGQQYLKRAIQGTSTVVSEEKTSWEVTMRDIINSSSHQIGRGYFVRPDKTEVTVNNLTETQNFYYDNLGNLTKKSSTNSEGKIVEEDYYYLHEIGASAYNFAETENLYSAVVQTKQIVGGVTLSGNVVDWSTGEAVNYPEENYVWDGTGTFSDYVFGGTNTNWRKVSTVTGVDSYGNVIEVRDDINDSYNATIMGYEHSLPVGEISNSSYTNTIVDVFEDVNLSNWIKSENGDNDTQWSVSNEQLKLDNYASATNGECDRIYHDLGAEVTDEIVFEFDVTIANSNSWDLTIGMGGSSWATGNGGSENAIWTAINNETWYYYAGAWYTIKSGLTVGETYHFKIVTRPSSNKTDYYIDGIKLVSNANNRTSSSGIQKFAFGNYGYGSVNTTWYVDNVRFYPSEAGIVSYDYKPLVGKTSETDINNQKLAYSYDIFNRLETIRDGEGNILEHREYSFKGNGEIGTAPPSLDASPTSLSPTYSSGSSNGTVTSNVNWASSISSGDEGWLSISPVSGSNNGPITISYTENASSSSRNGTVTLAGEGLTESISVTQAGQPKYITVSPYDLYFYSYSGSQQSFTISSNTSWTISVDYFDGYNWLSYYPISGTGNATVYVTCHGDDNEYWEAELTVQETGGGSAADWVWITWDGY